jgi:AcrR family transcriptional regulator
MGSLERREREKKELREKILEAARELFNSAGIEATTMRAIAERIEYSPTAIYSHFADKEALLKELCLNDFQSLAEKFAALEKVTDPLKRLRRMGQAYADFGIEYPQAYRFMFMTPKPETPVTEEMGLGDPGTDPYAALLQVVQACIAADAFKPHLKDAHLIAQTLWGGLHGVIALQLCKLVEQHEADFPPLEKRVKVMLDIMLDWLAA